MKRALTSCGAGMALLFVLGSRPAPAVADENCYACEMCYDSSLSCLSCGVMTVTAISGCCGFGSGQAYCVPDYGGFAVNCDSGTMSCQCNMNGNQCETLVAGG